MNVLFITHYGQMFGANRSMLQLILELKEFGVTSTVLMPLSKNNSDLKNILITEGISVIEAPIRWIKHPKIWKTVANYFYAQYLYPKVLQNLNNLRFDLIHTNSSVIGVGSFLSRKLKVPHVWHLREFGDIDYNLKTPFGKWFQRHLYEGEHSFIAISNKIKDHYEPFIDQKSIHVIYNGIKPPLLDRVIDKDLCQFCLVGYLHKNKGQLEVIKAFNELINNRGISHIHLTIIGEGNQEYQTELLNYVKDNKLESYVEFLGYRKDVNMILKKMTVGIMASANEAFGRVTVEYLMSGLAVIASDGGANTEIITDRKTGLVYHSGDTKDLADKINELIENPDLLNGLIEQGRHFAINNFSAKANAENIYILYKNILNTKK